jgi:hypothetical protein
MTKPSSSSNLEGSPYVAPMDILAKFGCTYSSTGGGTVGSKDRPFVIAVMDSPPIEASVCGFVLTVCCTFPFVSFTLNDPKIRF